MQLVNLDMEKFINLLKTCKPEDKEELEDGKHYLRKILTDRKSGLSIGDIDYEAFEEEDILDLLKNGIIGGRHSFIFDMAQAIQCGAPICNFEKKFF